MPELVIIEPGLQLSSADGKFVIRRGEDVVSQLPQQRVTAVFLATGVGVGASVIALLRQRKVPLIWTSERGDPLSWRADSDFRHARLKLKQAAATLHPPIRLEYARVILGAKLCGMKIQADKRLRRAASLEELRGIEGDSARAYFQAYWQRWPSDWRPERRSKRPPKDPANALLSYGYGLLSSWMLREVLVTGLEPGWGFLHATHSGMPSLTQDLIEPFRAALVDPWALAQTSVLSTGDFEQGEQGCRFRTSDIRKRLTVSFLGQLDAPLVGLDVHRSRSARKALRAVAREVAAALNHDRLPDLLG